MHVGVPEEDIMEIIDLIMDDIMATGAIKVEAALEELYTPLCSMRWRPASTSG